MSNQSLVVLVIATLLLFVGSACMPLMSTESRRIITNTHWAANADSASGQRQVEEVPDEAEPAKGDEEQALEEAGAEARGKEVGDAEGEDADGEDDQAIDEGASASAGPVGATASGQDEERMTLYIAYQEAMTTTTIVDDEGSTTMKSQLRMCLLQPDNSLDCSENPELNRMLNPHLEQ